MIERKRENIRDETVLASTEIELWVDGRSGLWQAGQRPSHARRTWRRSGRFLGERNGASVPLYCKILRTEWTPRCGALGGVVEDAYKT
jgi:hypothetical protein